MITTRLYYGWVLVAVLALTVTVSYGTLMYAFPVLLASMQADLGWSQATLTGAFSAAALTAGVVAIPVGRCVDRYGARVVMTAGSVAATLLLFAWSRARDPMSYYLVWIALGACMAAVSYEPAFTVVAHWFRARRARALTIITLAGGLASTIFAPLTLWLLASYGWRGAVAALALVLGTLTILPHALLLRRRPSDLGLEADGLPHAHTVATRVQPCIPARTAIRSASFRWLGASSFLSTAATFAATIHLVPILLERGHSLHTAGTALALLGFAKLPGRLLMEPAVRRWSAPTAAVFVLALQIAALLALIALPAAIGVCIFVALFGAGDGASTPARAAIPADFFGVREYGTITGIHAFFLALGRGAAPVGASLIQAAFGRYHELLWILAASLTASALALARAHACHRLGLAPAPRPLRRLGLHAVASFPGAIRLPCRTLHRAHSTGGTAMTTQKTSWTPELLEQTRRILDGATVAETQTVSVTGNAPAPAACCAPAKQAVCCEPSEKAACCGTAAAGTTGCGCQ